MAHRPEEFGPTPCELRVGRGFLGAIDDTLLLCLPRKLSLVTPLPVPLQRAQALQD